MRRIYGLDILRATAILFVIAAHALSIYGSSFNIPDGVAIFFVLSGYLIGSILFKTLYSRSFTLSDLPKFWLRRWLRTLPAYFFVLTILIIYKVNTTNAGILTYANYYFFIQCLLNGHASLFLESWSLCIEEWFYLIIPIIFTAFVLLKKKRSVIYAIIFIIIFETVLTVYRASQVNDLYTWAFNVRAATINRFDSIMFGVLMAYWNYFNHVGRHKAWMITGVILFLATNMYINFFGFDDFTKYYALPLESVAVFITLPYFISLHSGKGIIYRVLTFISEISYSMYLLSLSFFEMLVSIVKQYFTINNNIELLLYLLLVFGGAFILNRTIEKPFMRLRDKINFTKTK